MKIFQDPVVTDGNIPQTNGLSCRSDLLRGLAVSSLSAGIQQEMQPSRGTGLCRELQAPENDLIYLLKEGAMLGT